MEEKKCIKESMGTKCYFPLWQKGEKEKGMILELAKSSNKIIGWRLTVGTIPYLIWRDQEAMPGIRVGDCFVASIGETVYYEVIYASK